MSLRFNLQSLPGPLLSLFLLLGAPAPALAAVEGFTYSRNIVVPADVPSAAWVRVPLDADTLRHMAPGGADLHLFSPAGDQIPFRLAASLPASGRRPVQARGIERGEDGWTLLLDTGAGPVPHERLILDLGSPQRPQDTPLRLEGSPDGSAWQLLVEGIPNLEREPARLALSYPSTPDRYLRLTGQGALAKPPTAEVETVTGPTLALATRGASCDRTSSGPRVACTLDLPAEQIVRRLTVELKGIGPVGYRLYEPREARWHLLAEGVWETAGEASRHVLAGGKEPVAGALRLELQGPDETVPVLTGYGVDLAVPMVLFQAAQPGGYVLAYGGIGGIRGIGAMGEESPRTGSADAAGTAWVEPGPEQAHAARPLPSAPGAPLDGVRFSSSWNIASEAEPGELVRLEIPAAVYGASRESLADLRLSVAGRQVPFFRWSPPEPALTAGETGSRPGESGIRGESRLVVSLPAGGLPLTQIHLTAPGIPLRRPVSVRYVDPGRGPGPKDVAGANWTCMPAPPLPCRTGLPLNGPAPRLLTVRFQDGDNPPLPALDVQVWRRRDVLLFVWPDLAKGGEVQLLVGAQGLEEPRYDLAALGPALAGHPWEAAEIRSEHTDPPWWNGSVLPLGLTAAGIWLLVLLRRILSEA